MKKSELNRRILGIINEINRTELPTNKGKIGGGGSSHSTHLNEERWVKRDFDHLTLDNGMKIGDVSSTDAFNIEISADEMERLKSQATQESLNEKGPILVTVKFPLCCLWSRKCCRKG